MNRVYPLLINQAVAGTKHTGYRNRVTVRLASTANVAIATALEAGDTIDGVVLAENDLVLLKNQTAPAENGVYKAVAAAAGAASRAPGFTTPAPFESLLVSVTAGTANAGKSFASAGFAFGTLPVIDTTSITFTDVTGALTGSGAEGQVDLSGAVDLTVSQVQLVLTGTITTYTVTVQGRATPEAPWLTLDTILHTDALVNGTRKGVTAFRAFPYMRAWLSNLSGVTGSISLYLHP